ncbi:MAG: DegV family protein [Faecalibacterium sp.]
MKSKIVVDSAANLYQMEGIDFACAPIKVVTEEQEYPDDGRLDAVQVAETLRSYKGRSSTSCPNVGDWLAAYQGADQVFAITITGALSGSYNAALLAAQDYQEENPEAKVYVLDSLSAGPELQLLAERLRALFDAGTPFEEICVQMEEYKQHTHLLFSLESLNNLARNGRVSPAVAAVARMLGIRVVGTASLSGELEVLVKTRGEHGALERIVLEMKARGFVDGPVRILHCSNPAAATRLKNMITTVFEGAEVQIMPCGVLCSYYAELGGLMIGFEDGTAPAL